MAIGDVIAFAPELIRELPALLAAAQWIGYVFLMFFFGSIAVKGYRGYMGSAFHFILRVALGAAALLSGISLSGFLTFLDSSVYRIFQLDVIMGGIISTAIITLCVYMISHNIFNVEGIKKQIAKLEGQLRKAGDLAGKTPKQRVKDPMLIVGLAVLCVFLIFSAINFRGFPSLLDNLGLSEAQLEDIASQLEDVRGQLNDSDLGQGCVGVLNLLSEYGTRIDDNPYTNPSVKALIEQQGGVTIDAMYSVERGGETIIVGFSRDGRICSSRVSQFCECVAYGN